MKTRNSLENIDLLAAVRPFDAAPTRNLSETETIRSVARLEQILATNSASQPSVTSRGLKGRSARQTWGLRLAAIPVAAALIIAASVAWPGGGEDSQPVNLPAAQAALASWSALPSELPIAEEPLADAACRTELNIGLQSRQWGSNLPDPPMPTSAPVVSEARGNWGAVAFYDEGVQAGFCLLWLAHPEQPRIVYSAQTSFWDGSTGGGGPRVRQPVPIGVGPGLLPRVGDSTASGSFGTGPVDSFEIDLVTEADIVTEGPFTVVFGRVAPEVTGVAAAFDSGEVAATINNGRFLAWWPGTLAGVETEFGNNTYSPLDFGLNLESLTIRATLADGTVIERPALEVDPDTTPLDPDRPSLGLGFSMGLPSVEVYGVARPGVPVFSALPGGAGEAAGVQAGDLIIGVNEVPVVNLDTVIDNTSGLQVGDVVTLTVVRDGAVLNIEVVLSPWSDLNLS